MSVIPQAPPWTATYSSPNRSLRQDVPRRGVCIHHGAMTSLDGLRRLVMGAKQVSSTAICKDNHREVTVPSDGDRPWSQSSAYWDSALRSVETANESTDGWTLSDASHESLALMVAYWAWADGFWPHRDGDSSTWTVLGHREVYTIHGASYGTACPGGADLNRITRRAQQFLIEAPADPALTAWFERQKRSSGMYIKASQPDIYEAFTDPLDGFPRVVHLPPNLAAYAANVVITGDDATLTAAGIEGRYRKPFSPKVDVSGIDFTPEQLKAIADEIEPGMRPEQVEAAVTRGIEKVIATISFSAE